MPAAGLGPRGIALIALAGGVLAGGVEWLLNPPASWAQAAVMKASDGRLALSALQGGLFDGEAALGWRATSGTAQPLGRWGWHFGWLGSAPAGGLGWTVRTLDGPLRGSLKIQPGWHAWTLYDLQLTLPAQAVPAGLAAWDLLHAGGQLDLASDSVQVATGKVTGHGVLRWQRASVVLSPLAPLGSWEGNWEATGESGSFKLTTLEGPLHLDGHGRFTLDGRLGVSARAWAEPASSATLTPLLAALGSVAEDGSVSFEVPWPAR